MAYHVTENKFRCVMYLIASVAHCLMLSGATAIRTVPWDIRCMAFIVTTWKCL